MTSVILLRGHLLNSFMHSLIVNGVWAEASWENIEIVPKTTKKNTKIIGSLFKSNIA
jgi:hypothetical protein